MDVETQLLELESVIVVKQGPLEVLGQPQPLLLRLMLKINTGSGNCIIEDDQVLMHDKIAKEM